METEKDKIKSFKPVKFLMAVIYIILVLGVTTPIVLFYGPYENTRKAFIETLLATRHSYLLTNYLSEEKINEFLGIKETFAQVDDEPVQDIDKINVENTSGTEITRYNVENTKYKAYILEIKNPCSIKVAMTKYLGQYGQKTSEMAEEHNAIAAINGGSFIDKSTDGTKYAGTGGEPGGFVISDGRVIYPKTNVDKDDIQNVIAFTNGGKLIVGDHSITELEKLNVKEAMCFKKPTILIDGQKQIKDQGEDGYNPRTAVGQKADGTVIFLVIDGRKIDTIGASLYDVQEIMVDAGALNAGMLDGGYSSTMYYKGNVINSPNAWNGERSVATAFYVE